ncbi:MAG TPA: hypothetical protein VK702_09375 [Candidatus Acidoferrum sp.]|jgi:hypothetical protein|nr:hypothetical protein [Candidatus Acidoferrum sp.]
MQRRGGPSVNMAIYGQAFMYLARNPSIFALPLLAAVIDMFVAYWQTAVTDPVGGLGTSLFGFVVQLVYLFAFGGAVIQANNIARGYRAGFDDAWEETRRKAGGILLAAIGFQFVVFAAAYVGGLLGSGILQLGLQLIAYFFMILTIPAAAIGGLPGGLALSGSIRAVRSNTLACVILAVIFVALWVFAYNYVGEALQVYGQIPYLIGTAVFRAIVLAYLAFPFAVTYDETAFRGYR